VVKGHGRAASHRLRDRRGGTVLRDAERLHLSALEKEISVRIGEPVSIDNLHAAILPMPQARADGITTGSAQEIQVGKLTLKPDLWSLLRSDKVNRSVELEDVTLTHKALGGLASAATRRRPISSRTHCESSRRCRSGGRCEAGRALVEGLLGYSRQR
jgi:hypothetical protein